MSDGFEIQRLARAFCLDRNIKENTKLYRACIDAFCCGATIYKNKAIGIVEKYKVPVGNSVVGEMACEMTCDAINEIRDDIANT